MMDELIGRKVTGILVGEGEQILVFETDQGDVVYEAEGDCCSESWFSDILGVEALIGHTVVTVEERELPENISEQESRQEEDQIYGVNIVTDYGRADVVFRNSSNGYYGGWVRHATERETPPGLYRLTEDWAA